MDLMTYKRPTNATVFYRPIKRAGSNHPVSDWTVTNEHNGYLVWRGKCLDSHPWEESDWRFEIVGFFSSRDHAIEECIKCALDEESLTRPSVAVFNGA